MSKHRDPKILLQDMLHCIDKLERHTTSRTTDELMADEWSLDAIYRNFEVLGEAVNQLPKDIQGQAPDIPWRQIVNMRNRLIHDYAGIDTVLVLETLLLHLPDLKSQLEQLLKLL